jgi:hypothetical protein
MIYQIKDLSTAINENSLIKKDMIYEAKGKDEITI